MPLEASTRVLALIPARGGSKGIPGKNIKPFCERPLLAWSIDCALRSKIFSRVMVSTDDPKIADVALAAGASVPFLRPPELALDDTPIAPVLRHAVDWLQEREGETYDCVFILEPTAPARRPEHLVVALERLRTHGGDTVAGVSAVPHHFVPPKLVKLGVKGFDLAGIDGTPIGAMTHRRQSLPKFHALNGLIWGFRTELLWRDPPTIWGERVVGLEVPSQFAIDLDDPWDWEPAEARMRALAQVGASFPNP